MNIFQRDIGAIFSSDRNYRYALWRRWRNDIPYALFIGLNPSTADEDNDDPTIRRCKRFSKDWGYGGMYIVNLFALRATNPKVMLLHDFPVGLENDTWLKYFAYNAGVIVCAWGTYGGHKQRDQQVMDLLANYDLMCFGITKNGKPKHPLYIAANKQLEGFG